MEKSGFSGVHFGLRDCEHRILRRAGDGKLPRMGRVVAKALSLDLRRAIHGVNVQLDRLDYRQNVALKMKSAAACG
jgi:hypothetical protein